MVTDLFTSLFVITLLVFEIVIYLSVGQMIVVGVGIATIISLGLPAPNYLLALSLVVLLLIGADIFFGIFHKISTSEDESK